MAKEVISEADILLEKPAEEYYAILASEIRINTRRQASIEGKSVKKTKS